MDEIKELLNLIENLKNENENLRKEISEIKEKELHREKTFNELIKERIKFQKKTLNSLLREKELNSQLNTWKKIVDEMSHSINTDVFAALSYLNSIPQTVEYFHLIKKAKHNITRIRDITNLIMWDLNKERLPKAKEIHKVNLKNLIEAQIYTIKEGIDSLRLSIREHKNKLLNLNIPIFTKGICEIEIDDNLETALELICKDLLRNAFQYTDEEDPKIHIEIIEYEMFIKVAIYNNRIISKTETDWFNSNQENLTEEIPMSKSSKVGLRLVKKWCHNLHIESKFEIDSDKSQTIIKLQVPKLIKYEKI
ncbi:MAG: hypothetical protein N3F03_08280 [Ignavibacteria bacterium]|nr:hypothetical protein [Ignavibacteria bacterium]